jgi:hypothetical protein
MTGAVATMAVFPQIAVPTAMSVPSRRGRPTARLIQFTSSNAEAMHPITIGRAERPMFPMAVRLKRIPRSATPNRRIRFRQI